MFRGECDRFRVDISNERRLCIVTRPEAPARSGVVGILLSAVTDFTAHELDVGGLGEACTSWDFKIA